MDSVFANRSKLEFDEVRNREIEQFQNRQSSISRLVLNEDFRAWFWYIYFELFGSDFGMNELDSFTQGKRATMSFLKETLAIADKGPDLIAELDKRHYSAIGKVKKDSIFKDRKGDHK